MERAAGTGKTRHSDNRWSVPVSSPAESARRRVGRPTVAVTGAAGGIGGAVVAELAGNDEVRRAVGLALEPVQLPGVTYRRADVRDPGLAERLGDVDVVVHADIDTSPDTDTAARTAWNVRGTQTVLTAAAAAG